MDNPEELNFFVIKPTLKGISDYGGNWLEEAAVPQLFLTTNPNPSFTPINRRFCCCASA